MLGDAQPRAGHGGALLDERGVYVVGFSFPVVPQGPGPHPHADVGGAAPSADVDRAVDAFADAGRALGVI